MQAYNLSFTGDQYAFRKLCEVLPRALDDVLSSVEMETMNSSVFKELATLSPDILKSLYLLSFGNYLGFDKFSIEKEG